MNIPSLSLTTVKQFWIEEEGRELSETEVADILKYTEMWLSLKSLWYALNADAYWIILDCRFYCCLMLFLNVVLYDSFEWLFHIKVY